MVMELECDLRLGSNVVRRAHLRASVGRHCNQMVGWWGVEWDWGLCEKPVALDGLETWRVSLKLHSDRAKFTAPSQVGYVTK